ncbi:FecR domain-containing protein [Planctomycetota bacterium]
MRHDKHDDILLLLSRLVSKEISATELAELEEILLHDRSARDVYREFLVMYMGLYGPEPLLGDREEVVTAQQRFDLVPPTCDDEAPPADEAKIIQIKALAERRLQKFLAEQEAARKAQASDSKRSSWHWPDVVALGHKVDRWITMGARTVVGLAALAAIMIAVLAFIQMISKPRPHMVPAYLRVVAELRTVRDAQWAVPPTEPNLYSGPLHLTHGFAELVFTSGAQVILEAPTKVVLEKETSLSLQQGTLSATINDAAQGFTVHVPGSTIEDLGTQFGVKVQESGDSQTLVFDGRVRLQKRSRQGANEPVVVTEGYQVIANAQGKLGTPRPLGEQHNFRLSWHDVLYVPKVSGAVQVLRDSPLSVAVDLLEGSDHMFLFLERQGVTLDSDWEGATLVAGARSWDFEKVPSGVIKAGQVVDSYFLHFDPIAPSWAETEDQKLSLSARITFPRPIVGVVSHSEQLIESCEFWGNPQVTYEPSYWTRGLDADDFLEISDDRHTLTVQLKSINYLQRERSSHKCTDQLRVLIEGVADDAKPSITMEEE